MEDLINHFNNKFEELLIINGNSSDIDIRYNTTIELNPQKNYKLALKYFSVYNTIRNINDTNNKFRYSKDGGTTWIDKIIPPGSYEASEMVKIIDDESVNFMPHIPTNRFKLVLSNNRQVDFTIENSLREVLGFNSQVYTQTTLAENVSNIENNIDSINIKCNIIDGGYFNSTKRNIIYSIPSFTVAIGQKIIEQPMKPVYLPVNTSRIQNIHIRITDDNDNLIDFGKENVTIQLHLKQV